MRTLACRTGLCPAILAALGPAAAQRPRRSRACPTPWETHDLLTALAALRCRAQNEAPSRRSGSASHTVWLSRQYGVGRHPPGGAEPGVCLSIAHHKGAPAGSCVCPGRPIGWWSARQPACGDFDFQPSRRLASQSASAHVHLQGCWDRNRRGVESGSDIGGGTGGRARSIGYTAHCRSRGRFNPRLGPDSATI